MIFNVGNTGFEQTRRNIMYNNKIIVSLGEGSYIDEAELNIGDENCIVTIGKYTSIGRNVKFIIGLNHDYRKISSYPFSTIKKIEAGENDVNPGDGEKNKKSVVIGSDVWIGTDVTILGGVRIGNGAVIGAGAVIAKNIPAYAMVVGNPGRIIKYRFEKNVIAKLEEIKWWNKGKDWVNNNIALLEGDDTDKIYSCFIQNRDINEFKMLKSAGYYIIYVIPNVDFIKHNLECYVEFLKKKSVDKKILIIFANKIPNIDDNWTKKLLTYIDDDCMTISLYEYSRRKEVLRYIDEYVFFKRDLSIEMLDGLDDRVNVVYYGDINIYCQKIEDDGVSHQCDNLPLLTIGIPTYNRLKYLKKCLRYILEGVGNDKRVEIFVSDNNSKQDVADYLLQCRKIYKNVRYVKQEKNIGAVGNVCFLLNNASGEYVWILGDDDYLQSACVKAAVQALEIKDDISMLCVINSDSEYKIERGKGVNNYVYAVSFLMTALSTNIYQKKYIKQLNKTKKLDERLNNTLIPQMIDVIELLNKNDRYNVLLGKVWQSGTGESVYVDKAIYRKMGHTCGLPDLGKVFIRDYFTILEIYKKYGITDDTIKFNKKILLDNFLIPWCKLIADERVRWRANDVIYWFDLYYNKEEYYKDAKDLLTNILGDIDANLKEDNSDIAPYLD